MWIVVATLSGMKTGGAFTLLDASQRKWRLEAMV